MTTSEAYSTHLQMVYGRRHLTSRSSRPLAPLAAADFRC